MFIGNTISPEESTAQTEPSAPDEGASAGTTQEAKTDDRAAVYVKISQRARDILDSAATAFSKSRATVIEGLLESYDKQVEPKVREGILKGQNPTALKEHGELLQLRSWAEHAFENERYFWSGRMYKMLSNHPSCTEGMRNICDYRLSLCLIRLSYDVRREALERSVDGESYALALETLDKAIELTRTLRDRLSSRLLFPKLVLYYNLASCRSLKAQYLVESMLDPKSDEIDRLLKAKKVAEKEEVWKTIGQDWRNKLEIRNKEKENEIRNLDQEKATDVDSEASKAFDDLKQVFPVLSPGTTLSDPDLGLSSERIWLVDSSLNDEDLIFLRSDKQRWQRKFEDWRNGALRDRKPNSYVVRSLLGVA